MGFELFHMAIALHWWIKAYGVAGAGRRKCYDTDLLGGQLILFFGLKLLLKTIDILTVNVSGREFLVSTATIRESATISLTESRSYFI